MNKKNNIIDFAEWLEDNGYLYEYNRFYDECEPVSAEDVVYWYLKEMEK